MKQNKAQRELEFEKGDDYKIIIRPGDRFTDRELDLYFLGNYTATFKTPQEARQHRDQLAMAQLQGRL